MLDMAVKILSEPFQSRSGHVEGDIILLRKVRCHFFSGVDDIVPELPQESMR